MTPATFLPIIIIALVFASMGNTIGGIDEEIEEPPIIGYIDLDNSNLSKIATNIFDLTSEVVYNSTDEQEGINIVKEKDGIAFIIIQENFSENIYNGQPGEIQIYWIMKGAGILDSISSTVFGEIINEIDNNISRELIQNNLEVNSTTVLAPTFRNETTYFKGIEIRGLPPEDISGILSQQSTLIPIVMMMIIILSGSMVISSMALEKENKTLETLLTLPVKRTYIVAGKIIASAVIGLILAIIYMLGMSTMMTGFYDTGDVSSTGFSLYLSSSDFFLIGISVFVALLAALSLCMVLGTLAKNYKSAQALTFPVTMLALIPMFITMFKDFDTLPLGLKGVLFGIPFSHPMMAPRALLFDDYIMVIAGIIYMFIFALIMIAISVWIFKTDRLLTGSTNAKLKKIFKKR